MRVITIGRNPENDYVINESFVSRFHCKIVLEDDGRIRLIDHSLNGTTVNGVKYHRQAVSLKRSDVIRIGNISLHWQNWVPPHETKTTLYSEQESLTVSPVTVVPEGPSSKSSGLDIVALIVSILGAGLLIHCAIKILQWGIFGYIGVLSKIAISFILSLIAYILAAIEDSHSNSDSAASSVASFLSGLCLVVIIGFFLYWIFVDPDLLNPFRNWFK